MNKETGISIRVSQQGKNRIRRMAHKRGFETISAFLFWLIHQARIGKIVLALSLGLWLSGCSPRSMWDPWGYAVETRRMEAEIKQKQLELEQQKFELEKQKLEQKQSNQSPTE